MTSRTASAFLDSPKADLTDDGKVDFKDFAVLADKWLEEGGPPGCPDCNTCDVCLSLNPDDFLVDPMVFDTNDINDVIDCLVCILEMVNCYDWNLLGPNEPNLLQGYQHLLHGTGPGQSWGFLSDAGKWAKKAAKVVWDNTPEPVQNVCNAVAKYIPSEVEEYSNAAFSWLVSQEEAATEMFEQASNEMQDTAIHTFETINDYVHQQEEYQAAGDIIIDSTDEIMNVIGFRRRQARR